MGFGGSIMQWHPELDIGFAYATTNFYFIDLTNTRASHMQKAVEDSIRKL